jgi:hypothetical protein
MIYDFWWDTDGRSSHFLADINAPESVVNRMAEEYNEHTRRISFVIFLRIHNIPARSINPVEVEFYPKEEKRGERGFILEPDFARGAEIRQVQEKTRA